jgi:hypothetical protein
MPHHIETDVTVQRFGFTGDGDGRRLVFPHADTREVSGRSGAASYGASDCHFEALEGRLDTLRWTAEAASFGAAWLRDDGKRYDLAVERIEMPRGIMLTRAERGVELIAPHVSLSELRLVVNGPFSRSAPKPAASPGSAGARSNADALRSEIEPKPKELRQGKLRFLDSLSGRVYVTVKVQLDLPVLGHRSLDQQLRVPVQDGSLDFRALDDSLDWLEGAFLDIKHEDDRLAVVWKVPIFGSSHDLILWPLDQDATTLASFGRVPVRSLADFRIGAGKGGNGNDEGKKRKILQAFTLDAIDVALSLLAPRSVDIGSGTLMFGGDDSPGIVDLKVSGALRDKGAGSLKGAIGSVDTTIKDLWMGPVQLSADRLHFDGLDQLEVSFDGFRPTSVAVVVHRVTASNLQVKLGGRA